MKGKQQASHKFRSPPHVDTYSCITWLDVWRVFRRRATAAMLRDGRLGGRRRPDPHCAEGLNTWLQRDPGNPCLQRGILPKELVQTKGTNTATKVCCSWFDIFYLLPQSRAEANASCKTRWFKAGSSFFWQAVTTPGPIPCRSAGSNGRGSPQFDSRKGAARPAKFINSLMLSPD